MKPQVTHKTGDFVKIIFDCRMNNGLLVGKTLKISNVSFNSNIDKTPIYCINHEKINGYSFTWFFAEQLGKK